MADDTRPTEEELAEQAKIEAMLSEDEPQDSLTDEEVGVDPRDEEILKLRQENSDLKDKLLRNAAEAQNILRRKREEVEQVRKFASSGLVDRLLPVLDNFERTAKAFESGASAESIVAGVQVVENQLRSALEAAGVARIKSLQEPFDPELHEALTVEDSDDYEVETVIDEIEPGYKMHDRVIRAAKVRVAKKP